MLITCFIPEMKIPHIQHEKEMLNEENNLKTGGIIKSNSAWTTLRKWFYERDNEYLLG